MVIRTRRLRPILRNIEVKPTIKGIVAGRDELLEAALRRILDAKVAAEEIEAMAKVK